MMPAITVIAVQRKIQIAEYPAPDFRSSAIFSTLIAVISSFFARSV